MPPKTKDCFDREGSELVRQFARRVTGTDSTPEPAIGLLIEALRKTAGLRGLSFSLEPFLKFRNIFTVNYVERLEFDGMIQPLGSSYESGFKMVVKRNCPSTRLRFTMAHELCHTFFYEIVPELKFRIHEVDPCEERLCNLGAAELLMPSRALKRRGKGLEKSLMSLEILAKSFAVSMEAMLLRLQSLGLWESELSEWHAMSSGNFSLHRLIGGRRVEWEWSESHLLRDAWNSGKTLSGETYIEYRERGGAPNLRAVSYELKRKGNAIIALWSRTSNNKAGVRMPLFDEAK